MKNRGRILLIAVACLLGAAVAWKHQLDLDGSEFSGGRVTGPLLHLNFAGSILLILALPVVFLRSRAAVVIALVASLFCLPLYLYSTFPSLFRRLLPGEYSVPLQAFPWDGWSIAGILSILILVYVCVRGLLSFSRPKYP